MQEIESEPFSLEFRSVHAGASTIKCQEFGVASIARFVAAPEFEKGSCSLKKVNIVLLTTGSRCRGSLVFAKLCSNVDRPENSGNVAALPVLGVFQMDFLPYVVEILWLKYCGWFQTVAYNDIEATVVEIRDCHSPHGVFQVERWNARFEPWKTPMVWFIIPNQLQEGPAPLVVSWFISSYEYMIYNISNYIYII